MTCFLECSCCDAVWYARETFIRDPSIEIVGYQADFHDPEGGFFLFNHRTEDCGSTLAAEVSLFGDMVESRGEARSLAGTEECTGRCGRLEDLSRCEKRCQNSWVRDLLGTIVEHHRGGEGEG